MWLLFLPDYGYAEKKNNNFGNLCLFVYAMLYAITILIIDV